MKRLPIAAAGLTLAFLMSLAFAADKIVGDPKAGEKIFEANCEECHNAGSKEDKAGPGLKGVKDGTLPSGDPATQQEIIKLLGEGREEMPPFTDLTQEQLNNVSAYVLTL